MSLIIVASIHAKKGQEARVLAELEKLVAPTRVETGCVQYDLHRDNDDPAHFLFYEIWENRELWQQHMNAAHLTAYMQATEGAVETFTLNEMTKVA